MMRVVCIEPNWNVTDRCGVTQYWKKIREIMNVDCGNSFVVSNKICSFQIDGALDWLKSVWFYKFSDTVFHIQYPLESWGASIFPGFIFPLIAKIFRIDIISTLHEWQRMHVLRKISIYFLAILSKNIIFVSRQELDTYKNSLIGRFSNIFGQRLHLVPIGSNIDTGNISQEELLSNRDKLTFNIGKDSILIGVFGFIYSAKQPEKVIESIKIMSESNINAHLFFWGDVPIGNDAYRESLKSFVASKSLSSKVHFMGYINDNHDLVKNLLCMDVVVQMFDDGLSARRSSYWLTANLGVQCVTTKPKYSDEFDFMEDGFNPHDDNFTSLVDIDVSPLDLSGVILSFDKKWTVPVRRSVAPDWLYVVRRHLEIYGEITHGI